MQIHELNTGTLGDDDVTAIDDGSDTRKLPLKSAIMALIRGVTDLIDATIANLWEYVGTGIPSGQTVSGVVAEVHNDMVGIEGRLGEDEQNIANCASRITSAETAIGARLLVWTGQLTASVSCPAGTATAVFSAYDVSDYLPDGATLKAATVGWTTGNLIPVNVQVISGKLYVYLYNYKDAAVTVSNVAVQLFYTL